MEKQDGKETPGVESLGLIQPVRSFSESVEGFRWDEVSVLAYKPTGTHFKGITRQVLFDEEDDLVCQLRYFEIEPGGHSTLERHQHVHAVLILRGPGRVLVGDVVQELHPFDLVYVPPLTWHQFRANEKAALGFLCLVPCDRDRPQRPELEAIETLRAHPSIADFIRL